MKYKNILIDNGYKINLEKNSFFMAENNSNKSMVIGGVIIAFKTRALNHSTTPPGKKY